MKTKIKSIFNLIEIFRRPQGQVLNRIIPKEHCEQKHHHDFYCDAEKPFISIQ
ncbi:hypothetical protein [Maribacter sp. 2210JD10-5]|uniref:hypothetical protein n=1 Tax=Maribacter sp. 2210JD10-5 TaxID=3386272 RepID=UPI0039BC2D1A